MSKTSKELGVSSSISRMPKPKDLFEFPQNCPLSWVPLLQKIPPAGCQKNRDVFVKIDNVKPRHVATHVMQLWTFSRKKTPTKYSQLFSGRINDYVDLSTYGFSSFSFEIFGISPEKREIFANRIRQCWQNHTFGTTKNREIFCQCSYSSWNKVSDVILKEIIICSLKIPNYASHLIKILYCIACKNIIMAQLKSNVNF